MRETDEELYERFLAEHNEDDLRILLERHKESLILFINGFVHDLDDAEELMLDAFAHAAAGKSVFHGRSSFRTWLFSIGKKLALMRLRERRMQWAGDEEASDLTAGPPELELIRKERDRQLYQALAQLPPDYRQTLTLLYFEDMSYEEAARVMGKSRKQAYHRAERGRKALKKKLEEMGIEYDR